MPSTTADPEKFVAMIPVLATLVDDQEMLPYLDQNARDIMAQHGTVVGAVTRKILTQAEIDGVRLPLWDEEEWGVNPDDYVIVHYSAQLLRHR